MTLFSGLGVGSVMAAPSRLTWLRLATSKSARFGAASPTYLCERFCTSSSEDAIRIDRIGSHIWSSIQLTLPLLADASRFAVASVAGGGGATRIRDRSSRNRMHRARSCWRWRRAWTYSPRVTSSQLSALLEGLDWMRVRAL